MSVLGSIQTPWGELPEATEVTLTQTRFEGTGTVVDVVCSGQPRRRYHSQRLYPELQALVSGWQRGHNYLVTRNLNGPHVENASIDFARRNERSFSECITLYPLYVVNPSPAEKSTES